MDRYLQDCLEKTVPGEYILPFFWQHGENHEVLLEELEAIQKSGLTEFCVESRPYEHFCEESWWEDFGFLLKEAQKRNMRVWLLDDKHFPTGYANRYIASHTELRAVRLRVELRDFIGPHEDAALVPPILHPEEEKILTCVAYRRSKDGKALIGDGISLDSHKKDGLIWWNIPSGNWRIVYVIRTTYPMVLDREDYIDMMSPESCKAMIYGVYEPHYQHFKEYFGNTFAGFFSDEPGFSNEVGSYHSMLGNLRGNLPWNDTMPELLSKRMGVAKETVLELLPALWQRIESEKSRFLREAYMEEASLAFSRNFSWMLGNWCRDHGVMYIGHVIEDENAHQRLGHGCGHYFRALDGQDMAGIDIVLHQYIPGMTELPHPACLAEGSADPAFYHYALPKLASSHAHLQPLKKGRAMCEIYGGFGWAEGIPEMKQMTDLMLSGGINHFVPHAFNPKRHDPDHPPHFYAGGENPQFEVFGQLMEYTKRMAHLLGNGIHCADAAVYYNAEAEWSGGKNELQQEVCKELTQSQILFDLVSQDLLLEKTVVESEKLWINGISYKALVVPYSQYLPEKVLRKMADFAARGLHVIFSEAFPDASVEGKNIDFLLKNCHAVPRKAMAEWLTEKKCRSIKPETSTPSLHVLQMERTPWTILFLWNESLVEQVDTWISLPQKGESLIYDGWKNQLFLAEQKEGNVRIRLEAEEALALVIGPWEKAECFPAFDYAERPKKLLALDWKLSLKSVGEQDFTPYLALSKLENMAGKLSDFCGWMRYETILDIEEPAQVEHLEFQQAGELVRLWVNGEDCGTLAGKPYRFSVKGRLRKGDNQLCAEVIPNLGYQGKDYLSSFVPLPVTGLCGNVMMD